MKNKKLFILFTISAIVYFLQGIEGIPGLALLAYLKNILHFTPQKIMLISSFISLAWLCKIFWGILIDNYLSKKTWILISLIGSIMICLFFGYWSLLTIPLILIFSNIGSLNGAVRDVATDALMVCTGKKTNTCGNIQAIQWVSITIAGIIVGLLGGYIAQNFNYKIGYLALIPFYLIAIGIILFYKEKKRTIKKINLLKTIISYKDLFTNRKFLISSLFLFLYCYSPGFGVPLQFIQLDKFKWSFQFLGILNAITSVCSIIGAIIFYKICKKINIIKWLYYSVFASALTTICYLYFNPVSAVIYGILFSAIGMFVQLLMLTFVAKSSLKNREGTSFAVMCSVINIASMLSTLTGAWLFPKIGLQPLIVLSALATFLCLPLIKHLKIGEQK